MKFILPIAGKSSRFANTRPKWMLTMPSGDLMIEHSVRGIDFQHCDEIIIPYVEKQIRENNFNLEYLENSSLSSYGIKLSLICLDDYTVSQPCTIYQAIKASCPSEDTAFFVKDCDNYFEFTPEPENQVAYVELSDVETIAAANKSYITMNRFGDIQQIAEKHVISDKFCCGGYSFKSTKQFLQSCEDHSVDNNSDLYVSHIIKSLLFQREHFKGVPSREYSDFGTFQDFTTYIEKSKTYFVDFDGVLVENSSKFSNTPWSYKPIIQNIEGLKQSLDKSPSSVIVITTSRPHSEKQNIIEFLGKYSIVAHEVVCSLPHCSRILVNDFAISNPFPSASAINLPRNSIDLSSYL